MIHLYIEMGQEPNSLDLCTSLNFYMIPTCIHIHGMAFWLPRHFGVTRFLLNPSFRVPNLIENKVTTLQIPGSASSVATKIAHVTRSPRPK